MLKKRIFSILLSCVLLFCVSSPVFASSGSSYQIGDPRYIYTDSTQTKLTISSSGTATVTAKISGKINTTTYVEVDAYLEQYSAGAWRIVDSWSKSSSSTGTTLQETTSVSKGYKYRVKAFYYAYSGSNSESITGYSSEVSY